MLNMAYQEWMRTQPENSPWLNWGLQVSGLPIGGMTPQMYQPSGGSDFLGILGSLLTLPFLFKSSRAVKTNISQLDATAEQKLFDTMVSTPIFAYRYKWEAEDTPRHVGLIAEQAPDELTFFNKKMVGLYEYIAALHASIKVLKNKLDTLEGEK
jgi:hypothetical protein